MGTGTRNAVSYTFGGKASTAILEQNVTIQHILPRAWLKNFKLQF